MQTKQPVQHSKAAGPEEARPPRLQRLDPPDGVAPGCPSQPPTAGGTGQTTLLYSHNENEERNLRGQSTNVT